MVDSQVTWVSTSVKITCKRFKLKNQSINEEYIKTSELIGCDKLLEKMLIVSQQKAQTAAERWVNSSLKQNYMYVCKPDKWEEERKDKR